jgi:cytochrome b involved in lipid metabolism
MCVVNGVTTLHRNGGVVVDDVDAAVQPVVATNATMTKQSDSRRVKLPSWVRYVRLTLWIGLLGYLIYAQQNVNCFLLCGRIIHGVIAPLVALRDYDNKIQVTTTSVEYNIQTLTITGMFSYAVALWLLFMNPSTTMGSLLQGSRNKEFWALSIAAGFQSFDKTFVYCYCNPFTVKLDNWVWDAVYDSLGMPLLLSSMLLVSSVDIGTNNYTALAIGAFLLYRFTRLLREYKAADRMTTATTPKVRVTTMSVRKDTTDEALISSDNSRYVWRIYGNTYDMTDYVASHPGGTEAIMLGADREDSTALFQSYHAFNIRKAKAVLEKYRIKSGTESDAILVSPKQGHQNDLFYEELVVRVSKKLNELNIDPVYGRTGTIRRNLYYLFLITGGITTCIAHCKVRIIFGMY